MLTSINASVEAHIQRYPLAKVVIRPNLASITSDSTSKRSYPRFSQARDHIPLTFALTKFKVNIDSFVVVVRMRDFRDRMLPHVGTKYVVHIYVHVGNLFS